MWRAALTSILLAVSIIACGDDAEDAARSARPQLTPALARVLDATLREQVADAGIPGASAAIVFPDGRTWAAAAGMAVVDPPTPMTPRTAMPFDSITKVATSALALRLVEEGRLRLDDPIRRWYPTWRGDAAATVRDLLGHTSGLGDPPDRFWTRMLREPDRPVSDDQMLDATPSPGPRTTTAEYSNSGYALAGIVLRRVAREPVASAMRRTVLRAPGGEGLAMQPDERPRPPLGHSYWYPDGAGEPVDATDGGPLLPTRASASVAATAGSLAGDVPSLARWGHALLGGRVLRPSSLREMSRFRDGAFWEGYGLGLARSSVDEHVLWGHGGDGLGSMTQFWHLPRQDVTIAVTWNDDLLDDRAPFVPSLLRAVLEPPPR